MFPVDVPASRQKSAKISLYFGGFLSRLCSELEYIGLSSDKVPQHVSQQPATTMQPTQFLRVFAFLVVMEAPADGAPTSSPSDGGVGNDNDLPDMMSPLQVPTHCGPCGWIHYRNGNRNLFSRLDVTENIL